MSEKLTKVILKHGKELALKRFHPWVFSGAIHRAAGELYEGKFVRIVDSADHFLGLGYYLGGSLAIKVFSFEDVVPDDTFWFGKLQKTYEKRKAIGLTSGGVSNAYRLVFSEGDGFPGVVIDYYNGVAVIQAHNLAMHSLLPVLTEGLRKLYGTQLKAVYNKSAEVTARAGGGGKDAGAAASPVKMVPDQFLFGESEPVEITETGHRFLVDFIRGQKTGFFLDQRGNRMFAQFLAGGRKVLNACSYSGAFSVYAMKGGASEVVSVDTSRVALEWTTGNLHLNGLDQHRHRNVQADVKKFLAETEETFDMIILDPPAFAKSHQISNNALRAYVGMNAAAMRRLSPGGLLMTFSCSQPISREMFRSAIQAAAIESGRRAQVHYTLSQGPDHPVDPCHPEGEYLKGLILSVE